MKKIKIKQYLKKIKKIIHKNTLIKEIQISIKMQLNKQKKY